MESWVSELPRLRTIVIDSVDKVRTARTLHD